MARRSRVIAIDIRKPRPADWVEPIPEAAETLEAVDVVGGHFLARYLKDAHTLVRVHDLNGRHVRDIGFPGMGTVTGLSGKLTDQETFFGFASFTTPITIYRYDVASGESTLWRQPKLHFDPNDYETTQVFYDSKDGTRVPMFLNQKRGLNRSHLRRRFCMATAGSKSP